MGKTEQTNVSFKNKWNKNSQLAFEETLREGSDIFNWILTRNGWNTVETFRDFLNTKKRILDAGCGNGRVTALLRSYSSPGHTSIVGIDLISADVAQKNLAGFDNVTFFNNRDILGDMSDLGFFDFIYCQEVLHHTESPARAFENLCDLLEPEGEIAIYVYKKKAPIREYTDDFIRNRISGLPYDEALEHCRQITRLGKTLSELNVTVKVPEIKMLDIPEGEVDIQRFFYHFFCKCFWSKDMVFEDNAVINYDWYHPQQCTRHTLDEVRKWYRVSGLSITHECVDDYGITLSGKKNG